MRSSRPPPGIAIAPRPLHGEATLVDELVRSLRALGIDTAFGVSGGAIVAFCDALRRGGVRVLHFRHETGAAFAATEASLATGRPMLLFASTGPSLTNALTGLATAWWERAHVVLVSAYSSAAQRGRWAIQETSAFTMAPGGWHSSAPPFDLAAVLEEPAALPGALSRLRHGLSRPQGFVAHLALPIAQQAKPCPTQPVLSPVPPVEVTTSRAQLRSIAQRVATGRVPLWVGFGARNAAAEVRALAERTGAPVLCTPRGKGIFPEGHPQFVGVTGFGGHDAVDGAMADLAPEHYLVLGSRLGEFSSAWSRTLEPRVSFLHVDLDEAVFGAAYPNVCTEPVRAELGTFLRQLLEVLGPGQAPPRRPASHESGIVRASTVRGASSPVRPQVLMAALQSVVLDGSDCPLMVESGNSFAWGNHLLRVREPGRYRVSTGFGSMGQASAGVVGLALGSGKKAFAIVGDGAMLMGNELHSAVAYGVPAVWVVLNDARYGMIEQGMRAQSYEPVETSFPRVDFVGLAVALGAQGVRVTHEDELVAALTAALEATGPFVVDVLIDPTEQAPFMKRIRGLLEQGVQGGSR